MWKRGLYGLTAGWIVWTTAIELRAADTTETYELGATDFEFYMGLEGIGLGKYQKTVAAEALVGFGLIEGFSGYLTLAGESNEYFGEGASGFGFGVFGTPLDSDHADLDCMLHISAGEDQFEIVPGLEFNLDLEPDLALAGLYFRVATSLTGREDSSEDDPVPVDLDATRGRYVFAPETCLVVGIYWTMTPEQQWLLEYEQLWFHRPVSGERRTEVAGLALGYNVVIADGLELIGQIDLDLPQGDEDLAGGILLGLVVTMPSGVAPGADSD